MKNNLQTFDALFTYVCFSINNAYSYQTSCLILHAGVNYLWEVGYVFDSVRVQNNSKSY